MLRFSYTVAQDDRHIGVSSSAGRARGPKEKLTRGVKESKSMGDLSGHSRELSGSSSMSGLSVFVDSPIPYKPPAASTTTRVMVTPSTRHLPNSNSSPPQQRTHAEKYGKSGGIGQSGQSQTPHMVDTWRGRNRDPAVKQLGVTSPPPRSAALTHYPKSKGIHKFRSSRQTHTYC